MLKQSLSGSNSKRNQSRDWLILICISALTGFLLVTFFLSSFSLIDANVRLWSLSIQSNAVTIIANGISDVVSSLTLISLAISGYLFLKKHRAESLLLLGGVDAVVLVCDFIKNVVKSPGPPNGSGISPGFSYPSGHSSGVIVFVGLIVFLLLQHWNSIRVKVSLGTTLAGVSLLVGFVRLYLNVHWFSDIIGGYLLGIFLLTFSILIFNHLRDSGKFQYGKFKLISLILFALTSILAIFIFVISF